MAVRQDDLSLSRGRRLRTVRRLPRWQRWLFRRAYFNADAAIRLSESNPEDGAHGKQKREYLIPNGIVDACPDFATVRSEAGHRADGPMRVLYVGVMSEAKEVNVLVEACGKLRRGACRLR